MEKKGYKIQSNGDKYRVYRKVLFFKFYIGRYQGGWATSGVFVRDEFDSIAEAEQAISDELLTKKKLKWTEVDG